MGQTDAATLKVFAAADALAAYLFAQDPVTAARALLDASNAVEAAIDTVEPDQIAQALLIPLNNAISNDKVS